MGFNYIELSARRVLRLLYISANCLDPFIVNVGYQEIIIINSTVTVHKTTHEGSAESSEFRRVFKIFPYRSCRFSRLLRCTCVGIKTIERRETRPVVFKFTLQLYFSKDFVDPDQTACVRARGPVLFPNRNTFRPLVPSRIAERSVRRNPSRVYACLWTAVRGRLSIYFDYCDLTQRRETNLPLIYTRVSRLPRKPPRRVLFTGATSRRRKRVFYSRHNELYRRGVVGTRTLNNSGGCYYACKLDRRE